MGQRCDLVDRVRAVLGRVSVPLKWSHRLTDERETPAHEGVRVHYECGHRAGRVVCNDVLVAQRLDTQDLVAGICQLVKAELKPAIRVGLRLVRRRVDVGQHAEMAGHLGVTDLKHVILGCDGADPDQQGDHDNRTHGLD